MLIPAYILCIMIFLMLTTSCSDNEKRLSEFNVGDSLFVKKAASIDLWQRIRYIRDEEIDTMKIKDWEKLNLKNELKDKRSEPYMGNQASILVDNFYKNSSSFIEVVKGKDSTTTHKDKDQWLEINPYSKAKITEHDIAFSSVKVSDELMGKLIHVLDKPYYVYIGDVTNVNQDSIFKK